MAILPRSLTKCAESLRTASVAISIAATLFGVIEFGVGKITLYDSYATRLAKLEAQGVTLRALSEDSARYGAFINDAQNERNQLARAVDQLSSQVVELRVQTERLTTIVETEERHK